MKKILIFLFFIILTLPAYSAVVINDTFTEASNTNISAHTPDVGGAWSSATNVYVNAASDNLQNSGDGGAWVFSSNNATIGDDEMDISANINITTADCCRGAGISGRIPAGESGSSNSYLAALAWPNANTDVTLRKYVASVGTTLGTYTNNDGTALIKLEIRDAAKKVYVDGTERLSSTDNNLTGNNFAGLFISNKWSQIIDNYLAESVTAATQGRRRIILTENIKNYIIPEAEAQEIFTALDLKYYTSPVCGDGISINLTTGAREDRHPCIVDTYKFPSWVLIYDKGNEMVIKAISNTTLESSIPQKNKITKQNFSKECKDYIALRGESTIESQ